MTIILQPASTRLAMLEQIWRGMAPVVLAADALPEIQKSADLVAIAAKGEREQRANMFGPSDSGFQDRAKVSERSISCTKLHLSSIAPPVILPGLNGMPFPRCENRRILPSGGVL